MSLISRLFGGTDVEHGPMRTYREEHRPGADGVEQYPARTPDQNAWERPQPPARVKCSGCGTVTSANAGNPSVACDGCSKEYGTVLDAARGEAADVTFICPWCDGEDTDFFDPRPADIYVLCNDCDFEWDYDPY